MALRNSRWSFAIVIAAGIVLAGAAGLAQNAAPPPGQRGAPPVAQTVLKVEPAD